MSLFISKYSLQQKNKASVHIHLPFCDKKCSLQKLRGKYRFQTGQAEKKNQSINQSITTVIHIKNSFENNFGTPQAKERLFKVLYCINGKRAEETSPNFAKVY